MARRPTLSDAAYLELMAAFPLRKLRTSADHSHAKQVFLSLSTQPAGKSEARHVSDYLELLADLIADYERRSGRRLDTSHLSTADLVRHRMGERGLSIQAAARLLSIPPSNLSDMLHGRRDWSKAAIRTLVRHFHISAERLLGVEPFDPVGAAS